jgi:zinc and cadmium transporter
MLFVLVAYLALIVLASLGGGWLTSRMRLTHTRMQLIMSFVAGLMLGVCFLHMVPHSMHATRSADLSMIWLVAGLLTTFFLIRAFQFHQHVSAEGADRSTPDASHKHGEHSHTHDGHEGHVCEHGHPADHAHARPHELSWVGVFIGLALHSALDGLAVAAAVTADARVSGASGWYLFGLGTFLGVLLHKPLDALSVTSLMAAAGWPTRECRVVNAALALMCPLGAAAFYLGIGMADAQHDVAVGCALAFSAGVFVCIALGDLLPELQFHTHDRIKLSLALLLGVAVAMSVWLLEPPHIHGG